MKRRGEARLKSEAAVAAVYWSMYLVQQIHKAFRFLEHDCPLCKAAKVQVILQVVS